jgi:hypothetical protein
LGAVEEIKSRSTRETCAMIKNLRVKENAEKNQEQATAVMLCNLEEIKDLGKKKTVSELVSNLIRSSQKETTI